MGGVRGVPDPHAGNGEGHGMESQIVTLVEELDPSSEGYNSIISQSNGLNFRLVPPISKYKILT